MILLKIHLYIVSENYFSTQYCIVNIRYNILNNDNNSNNNKNKNNNNSRFSFYIQRLTDDDDGYDDDDEVVFDLLMDYEAETFYANLIFLTIINYSY